MFCSNRINLDLNLVKLHKNPKMKQKNKRRISRNSKMLKKKREIMKTN